MKKFFSYPISIIILIILLFIILFKPVSKIEKYKSNSEFLTMVLYVNSSNALELIEKTDDKIVIDSGAIYFLDYIENILKYSTQFLSYKYYYKPVFNDFVNLNFDKNLKNEFDSLEVSKGDKNYNETIHIVNVIENLNNAFEKPYKNNDVLSIKKIFKLVEEIIIPYST